LWLLRGDIDDEYIYIFLCWLFSIISSVIIIPVMYRIIIPENRLKPSLSVLHSMTVFLVFPMMNNLG